LQNSKPKIVVDLDRLKYPHTGMFYFCKNLYQELIKNEDFDFHFYVHPNDANVSSNRYVIKPLDRFFLKPKSDVNVWHTTSQLSVRIPSKPVKLVYTIHDLNFLYSSKPTWKKRVELKKIQKRIDRADYITCISKFTLEDVKKYLDIQNKKVKVIYNGVNVPNFEINTTDFEIPKSNYILSIGVIAPKKNIHTIIPLLRELNVDWYIVGQVIDPNYQEKIIQLAKEHQVLDKIHFTGSVSEDEKYGYLQHCEAMIFPSLSEGFGLPPIEAMRMGKPVFLSKLTSLPEIGGNAAYYFDDFDPESMLRTIQKGLEDYRENNKKEALIKWSMQFTWEKTTAEYIEIYNELAV
jgi:glycosyltransferase involved in cell wall biosynthesis